MAVKQQMMYEGKAKKVFLTDDPKLVIVDYKDDATAFNGEKKGQIVGKGALNNRIASIFFRLLESKGIPTHYVETLSEREMLVKKVQIVPIELVVRNIAAGSLAKRIGWEEGTILPKVVIEFYYKDDELGDPLINRSHIDVLNLATPEQIADMEEMARQINIHLKAFLADKNLLLVDFKLEFGVDADGNLLLADEISPDTCRFWDADTKEKLDKDRFRRDLGSVEQAYEEIFRRLGGVTQ
ncbi:phosphoribosylaminoimidazolesuccinocarboxamide synthase [Effusibacillus dendaii]|uniref:Phosphoribosylaminoimidazole-succinocarboxamide synthase n=1 Tax=Effusibacillus dendaii TaxID=2743772 RepID=A0A7I8DE88_9BACL|nr:phosphoribosylaminoimidazolesuccinocarboxamide synthase [Effusibacillus dendaii]BCJ87156.1 phosphoribosylaminoimidazole-succinocarboxamide synthase [Effusibacillus dendaii]